MVLLIGESLYSGYDTFYTGNVSYGSFAYDVAMIGVAFIPLPGASVRLCPFFERKRIS